MHASSASRSFRAKALGVILAPILISAVITTLVMVSMTRSQLKERADQFGGAIADQLAITIADQVVQKDILGLNVVLNNLQEKRDFVFASVYGTDNHLLAQAGKNSGDLLMFSRDVVFQNASAGYLQLGLRKEDITTPANTLLIVAIGIHAILLLVIGLFGWTYADLVYLWFTVPRKQRVAARTVTSDEDSPSETSDITEQVIDQTTILVIKIRPVRLLDTAEPRLMRAFSLYSGEIEVTEGSDLVLTFRSPGQILEAIRCGLLINKLMHMERASATVKLGVHTLSATQGPIALAKARKQATYISSISENKLLASREVFEVLGPSEQVKLQAFHSSLAPDGEVYFIDTLAGANEELIQRQARQLRQS